MTPALVQRGYTVAILYAKRHVFKFGEPGIRHEDPRMIKVRLPQQLLIYMIELDSCSLIKCDVTQIFSPLLHKLLALNDQVQQFLTELDDIKMCHRCSKKAASMQRCSKCMSFWYYDKTRLQLKIFLVLY